MKTFASLIRVLLFLAVAFILFEVTVDSGDQWAVQKYPIIWAVLGVLTIFSIAIEIAVSAMRSILYKSLNAEAKERYHEIEAQERENNWFKTTYKKLLGSKPIEKEADIILDHNYDGIKELDNTLPPWWVYLFYISIVFGVVYLARYHVFDGVNTADRATPITLQLNIGAAAGDAIAVDAFVCYDSLFYIDSMGTIRVNF